MSPTSFIYKLDPRAKLIIAFFFSLVTALANSSLQQIIAVILGFMMWFLSALPVKAFFKKWLAVNVFIVFVWLALPWQYLNASFQFSSSGISLALAITLKVNAIFLVWVSLLSTSSANQLLHALAHLHLPEKLVMLFFLFFRYLQLIMQQFHKLKTALLVRGFKVKFTLHTFRAVAQVMGTLLLRSLDRSEKVYQAMLCRGFNGTFWMLDHFSWSKGDSIFFVTSVLAILGLFILGFIGPI